MTIVRYNESTCEYEIVDNISGRVLDSGLDDLPTAKYLASLYENEE